jgi:dipeptidyl aminopeptidase/acylaminoacyl peptidase
MTGPAAYGQDMAAVFGAREAVVDLALSPDGTRVAYQTTGRGRSGTLFVVDISQPAPKPKAILNISGSPERLDGCAWVGDARLLCTIYASTDLGGQATVASRLIALDADGSNMKVLQSASANGRSLGFALWGGRVIDWSPPKAGSVLISRRYIPEEETGTRVAQTRSGLGVDLVDSTTLKTQTVEVADDQNAWFLADGYGNVRVRQRTSRDSSGYDREVELYAYRKKDSREWLPLSTVRRDQTGFSPHAIDDKLDVAYGLKRVDGRLTAFKVALDGSLKEEMVFQHPEVDVAGFIRIGPHRRVVGVRYVTDRAEVRYLDPAVEAMARALAKALPNLPLIRVVDTNRDETKMLIWAGSDVDPGIYYVFDRKAGSLTELIGARNGLEKVKLAPMVPVRYPAADGAMVPGYLTLPPDGRKTGLPALVMPHGGPSARDEWNFDWLVQYFATQGYAVLQPNFRGSAGYGDAWFQQNGFVSWKTAIGDVTDAGRWLVKQGIADPGKLGIFGWSYGGYAALQSAVVAPDLFKAVVAVAPVTDLERLKQDHENWSNYAIVSAFIGSGRHIAEGSPARHAEAIKAPVLMFHGDADSNVQIGHGRLMQSRLQAAGRASELVVFKDLDHYLEDSTARADMLRKSKSHLEAAFAK